MVVMRFSNGSDYDRVANDHIFLMEILSQLHTCYGPRLKTLIASECWGCRCDNVHLNLWEEEGSSNEAASLSFLFLSFSIGLALV